MGGIGALSVSLPIKGTPNTEVNKPGPNGPSQTRKYGPDGWPTQDIDFDHTHDGFSPHIHDWTPNPGGGRPTRGPGRPANACEE